MALRDIGTLLLACLLLPGLAVAACSDGEEAGRDQTATDDDISLRDLVRKAGNGEYLVTYEVRQVGGTNGQYTIALKGEKTYGAFDFGESGGGSGRKSIEIDDGTTSYSCGDALGLWGDQPDASPVCHGTSASPRENDMPHLRHFFNPAGVAVYLASVGAETGRDGSVLIAGRTAKCYKVEDQSTIGKGRVCLEEALGVPLLIETTDAEGLESSSCATEFRDQVGDSIFQPPYPVR